MVIYFAAPLHNKRDQMNNAEIVAHLRLHDHKVYLPQEHGIWEEMLEKFGNDEQRVRRFLYELDVNAMNNADCCVAYVEHRKPSEGMLWEMGYMKACNKNVYLLNPNAEHRYNLMPEFGSIVFTDLRRLIEFLDEEAAQ